MVGANALCILTHDPTDLCDDVVSSSILSSLPFGIVFTVLGCVSLDAVWFLERSRLFLGSGYPVVGSVVPFARG